LDRPEREDGDAPHRGADGHTTHSSTPGPDGKPATRDATVVNDREAGTHTKDVTWTGENGKTATRHTEVEKTEDGRTSQTVVTHPDGSTTTRTGSVSRAPAPPAGVPPAGEPPAAE
jgi:hypothetical protein